MSANNTTPLRCWRQMEHLRVLRQEQLLSVASLTFDDTDVYVAFDGTDLNVTFDGTRFECDI